jgi:hypothetical protein
MYSQSWINNVNKTDILPPLTVKKSVKNSDAWKQAVMDSFEHIARLQFEENMKFWDYYRMVDGKMSYMELKEVVPHLDNLQNLLDGVGIEPWLKHYDILGGMIRDIVGKYIDMQDKFHVTDTSEIAQNEYLRFRDEEIHKHLNELIEDRVKRHLAENGMTLEGREFSSPEEQQQYLQQIEAEKEKATPKDTRRATRSTFKTLGMQWGEATLEKDKEHLKLLDHEKTELTDKLLTGRCFREHVIVHDRYFVETWSPKNTFFSKEMGAKYAQDGEYVGRLNFMTPSELIKKYGHRITTKNQKELLGGNQSWKTFVGDGVYSGTIEQSIRSNFNVPTTVPFAGYPDYNFYVGLQEELGIPMGEATWYGKDGSQVTQDRFLPKYQNRYYGVNSYHASVLRDDFQHRTDLCQVTEVYFLAYDLYGFLTYETESGRPETVEVTEDILPQVLQEKNIKATYKESIHDMVSSFEVGTLKWLYRPVCYKGVKVQSGNLTKPLYLYCEPDEHQIQGDSPFDIKLPVAGWIGKPWADKIFPYQAAYNVVMNQIYNLLEKEIGIFFLLDVSLIPSEIDGWGDAQEAMIAMRNLAKDIGLFPVQTSGDQQKNQNNFNQFTTHNLSYAGQIQYRIALADKYKSLAYEALGSNPNVSMQPSKYETAEGIRVSQEASFVQLADVFHEFSEYNQSALELLLSVAQYCQSNKKDISVAYTKSDASMVFLQMSDPDFPLRRMGLIPSKDGKKRKELETFKQYVMNNNTAQTDFFEVAKLISSDTMTEVLDIAQEAVRLRAEQEEMVHARQKQLQDNAAELQSQILEKEFEKELLKIDRQNEGKIVVAEVTAKGRAADKQSSPEGYEEIEKSADRGLKEAVAGQEYEVKNRKLDIEESKMAETRKEKMQALNIEMEKLRNQLKVQESKERIAAMNKN